MALVGSIKIGLNASLSATRDLGSASCNEALTQSISISDGATANKATQAWGDTRTLAATTGATPLGEDLDLNGALTNGLGASVALTRVIAVGITAAAANTVPLVVGGAATGAWEAWTTTGATVTVRPGGSLILVAPDTTGYPVTAGSADKLRIANSATSAAVTYSILVMGSQA